MKITILAVCLSGCATSPAGLYATRIEKVIESPKPPNAFAICVAEVLGGDTELRSDGSHYWVMRNVAGVPRHRWDFTPQPNGSKAELRSTGIVGAGADKVQSCANL